MHNTKHEFVNNKINRLIEQDFVITSTKIRKERSLFNAVQRNAFVKNAVAFLKLF